MERRNAGFSRRVWHRWKTAEGRAGFERFGVVVGSGEKSDEFAQAGGRGLSGENPPARFHQRRGMDAAEGQPARDVG